MTEQQLCECCDASPADSTFDVGGMPSCSDIYGARMSGACYFGIAGGGRLEEFARRVRERRAARLLDRPIQAGDWVECVNDGGFSALAVGNRFTVKHTKPLSCGKPGLDIGCGRGVVYLASRFKRVDGPHAEKATRNEPLGGPVTDAERLAGKSFRVDGPHPAAKPVRSFGESEEICASCSEAAARSVEVMCEKAGDGRWYCEGCIDGAREMHGTEAAPLHAGADNGADDRALSVAMRECSDCGAEAPLTEKELCAYCANETEDGLADREHIDMVTANQMLKGEMSDGSVIPGELKARARNAAWELAGKPRVTNAADARAFSLPHPWSEFDELESR